MLYALCLQVYAGWWKGILKGKEGLFPSNYVRELMASKEDKESSDAALDETGKTHQMSGLFIIGAATPSH